MKKAIIAIAVVLVLLVGGAVTTYNSLVTASERVESAQADIQTQLQRRADLIPNLLNSVKGYMEYEQGIIDSITSSREKLMGASTIEEMAAANDELTASLKALNVVIENYPDLKASENFIQLQDELAGTENRIATARKDYNDTARAYNTKIKRFPGAVFAGMFGFEKAAYFEAAEGSEAAPNVEF